GAFGEVQVMDWGLAKVLAEEPGGEHPLLESHTAGSVVETVQPEGTGEKTFAGTVLGTYAYMPPEQARGEVHLLDRHCDVFGLGGILCEILTGQPPYIGTTKEVQAHAQAGHLGPAGERLEGCGAGAELVELARSCLASRPEDRPADSSAVASAVGAYQAS